MAECFSLAIVARVRRCPPRAGCANLKRYMYFASLRHFTQSRKILLIVGVLISGGLGCTSVSPPKAGFLGDAAAGGASGALASGGRDGGGGGAGGDAAGLSGDGKIATDVASAADVPASGGGTGGAGGSGGGGGNDASAGSSGGAVGNDASAGSGGGLGGSTGSGGVVGSDASAGSTGVGGGSAGSGGVGGGSAGSGGSSGAPDAAPDVRIVDASGTCSVDNECSAATPLCLGNRCAKCSSDTDCVGRAGPACVASSGLCAACTADSYCTGSARTCDTATNQCVGCTKRSDCAGACLTCSAGGVCTAVKSQNDPTGCTGTCDSTGACKATQGQTCKANSDCAGGLPCVDGLCCNSACSGSCQACDVTPGTCTTLGLNATPHPGHAPCVASDTTCAGKCSGTSATCSYPTSSTSCGSTCTGSTLTPKACDSAGACVSGTNQSCAPYVCDGTVCSTTKKLPGSACTSTADCDSGFCVDNPAGTSKICCSSACSAGCQACKTDGSACTPKNAGVADSTCGTSAASCQNGTCNGAGACAITTGATCGSASCVGAGSFTPAPTCTSGGQCNAGQAITCSSGACSSSTACATTKGPGASCAQTSECNAGLYCTNGVCCTSSSCGKCHACNLNGAGTCSAVAAGTSDAACPADSSNCMYGGCNGSGDCQASPSGTACGGGTVCTDDPSIIAGQRASTSLRRNKKCNGTAAGAAGCLVDNVSTPTTCGAPQGAPGLTCQDAVNCKTSCFVESDCSQYFFCAAGACTAKNGATCADATQCTNGACTGSFVNPTPTCKVCITDYTCPITAPNCQLAVGTPGCVACNSAAQSCNADGSVYCPTQTCPSNAPDCGADHHCHCGTGAQCPSAGQICVSGQCKMAGQWPCINSGDCAYGTCTGGVCPQTSSGQLCTGVLDSECSTGYCNYSNKCP